MRILDEMSVTVDVKDLLKKLHANRENHAKIVAEAKKGYLTEARKAIAKRMEQLEKGKIVSLHFSLSVPQDFTYVYDTAIEMLQMHQGETVKLNATQVRHLAMDQWDWRDSFLASNSSYSATARSLSNKPQNDEDE